jgi:hypothetical protein
MSGLIASVLSVLLSVAIIVLERLENSGPTSQSVPRKLGRAAKGILLCAAFIMIFGVVSAFENYSEEQASRAADAENKATLDRLYAVITEARAAGIPLPQIQSDAQSPQALVNNSLKVATSLVIAAEQQLSANDLAGALKSYRQASQLAKVDAIEARIADISARMTQAPTPKPEDTGSDEGTTPEPRPEPAPMVAERCQDYQRFKLCTNGVTIARDRIYQGATVNLVVRALDDSEGPIAALFPMVGAADLEVGGIADWRFARVSGIARCNSSSPPGCLRLPEQFTRLREGSVITVHLVKNRSLVPDSLLEGVRTASVSGQILVIAGSTGSVESFGFSEIPATVRLGQ